MKLLPLVCPNCQEWLKAGNLDLVVSCPKCHRPVQFDTNGIQLLDVSFAQPTGIEAKKVGKWPLFWVFTGQVAIQTRYSQSGDEDAAAQALWGQPRRFYIPAWELPIETMRSWGSRLITVQPALTQMPAAPDGATLTPATVTAADAEKLIEFIVLDIEARRSDMLRDLQFTLTLAEPTLWALPLTNNKLYL